MPVGSPIIYDFDMQCFPVNDNSTFGQVQSHVCAGVGTIPNSVAVGDVDYFRVGGIWYKISVGSVIVAKIPYFNNIVLSPWGVGALYYDVNGTIAELHKGSVPRDYVNRIVDEVYPWMPYTFE